MTRTAWLGMLLSITLLGSACASSLWPDRPPPVIKPLVDGHCPRDGAGLVWASVDTYLGSLPPDGFQPVKVVRCVERQSTQRKDGTFLHRIEELSGTPSPRLLKTLQLPDGAPADDVGRVRGGGCPAREMERVFLLLVNAEGRGYQPRMPVTFCFEPRPEVMAALGAIPWAPVERVDVVTKP
jgi:hypothetical protein